MADTTTTKDRELVYVSPLIKRIIEIADRHAKYNDAILIKGETGTGKENIARYIHKQSGRENFTAVNCAALPEPILESLLFGHEKGAFTGADKMQIGLFEEANGGTLFLDEIGEMTPSMQGRLLRVLDTGEFNRVGSTKTLRAKPRIIAATSRDIQKLLEDGNLRPDLYHRICQLEIHVPPLRRRVEDIPVIAQHYMQKKAAEYKWQDCPKLSDRAIAALMQHEWKGNVRELENKLHVAMIEAHAKNQDITTALLGLSEAQESVGFSTVTSADIGRMLTKGGEYNLQDVAAGAGVNRTTLYKLLQPSENGKGTFLKLAKHIQERDGDKAAINLLLGMLEQQHSAQPLHY